MSAAGALGGWVSVPFSEPCSEPSVDGAAATLFASAGAVRFGCSVGPASTALGATDASDTCVVGMASGVFSACGEGNAACDFAATGRLRCQGEGRGFGLLLPGLSSGVIATPLGRELSLGISTSISYGAGRE